MPHGSGAGYWAVLLAVAGMVVFVLGPLLAHFGILRPMQGFVLFDLGGLLGVVALLLAIVIALRSGIGPALGGLIVGGAVAAAFVAIAAPATKFPPINDITTDVTHPPEFLRAPTLPGNQGRDLRYPGMPFAEQQQKAYPDLAPLRLPAPPDDAFQRALVAAKQMPDWEITRVDVLPHVLEGVATSRLFRFQDDFVIEVRPQDNGSAVHMRSKSRDGKGDIGANATRIKAYFAKLQDVAVPK